MERRRLRSEHFAEACAKRELRLSTLGLRRRTTRTNRGKMSCVRMPGLEGLRNNQSAGAPSGCMADNQKRMQMPLAEACTGGRSRGHVANRLA
jgi:hypothetical protein